MIARCFFQRELRGTHGAPLPVKWLATRVAEACDNNDDWRQPYVITDLSTIGLSSSDAMRLYRAASAENSRELLGTADGSVYCTAWFHAALAATKSPVLFSKDELAAMVLMADGVLNYLGMHSAFPHDDSVQRVSCELIKLVAQRL